MPNRLRRMEPFGLAVQGKVQADFRHSRRTLPSDFHLAPRLPFRAIQKVVLIFRDFKTV
jgi:hypothetical protein